MSYVCFDIGGTAIKYVLIEESGEIVSRGSSPTNQTSTEEFVQFLVQKVKRYEKTHIIEGIGISVPGIVEKETGRSITAGAITHLYGRNIKEILNSYFSYPVHVENDARCALKAELSRGSAQGLDDVLLMTIGTGIGGAVAYDGRIIYGKNYKTGEFGMMRLEASEHPSQTMHEVASTSALIKGYKKLKQMDTTVLVDAKAIFSEMSTDKEVAEVVDKWLDYLTAGIFNVAASFNPERIVIGGGISANPILLPMIKRKLILNPHWEDYQTQVATATFKNDAGVMGALAFLLEKQRVV